MRIKIIICLLFIAFIVQSCKPKRSDVVLQFSEEIACEKIDKVFVGVPLNMGIYKDELFIGDFHAPMILYYNLKDEKINRFLSKGRGPGETMPPVMLYANPIGDNRLYRYSKQVNDMGFYPLDSLSVYIPLFKLPFGFFNVIPYEKDRYLSAGLFRDEHRYRVLNAEGKVIGSFGDYPDFLVGENLISFGVRAMFHHIEFANSYHNRKLVAASQYVLDIIDYSLDITKESIKRILLASYDYEYDDYTSGSGRSTWAQEKRGTVIGVSSVACDDTYIYLLFNPGFVREENKGVKKEIWVFDWNGQPVKKLILDKDVKKITADPYSNEHTIFGLAYESNGEDEQYVVVKVAVKL